MSDGADRGTTEDPAERREVEGSERSERYARRKETVGNRRRAERERRERGGVTTRVARVVSGEWNERDVRETRARRSERTTGWNEELSEPSEVSSERK